MRKKVLAMLLSVSMIASGLIILPKETTVDVQAANGELKWSDEFDGTSLDTSVWSYDIGNGNWGWGNGEVEFYTDRTDNVTVEDGYLKIIAKKENYSGKQYTSGRILTKGKKAVLYGKIEAKIKVENGNQDGIWPAFWMMGNNMADGVGWPNCGEIDIMEHANANPYVSGCLHWNTGGINATYSDQRHGSYGSGFEGAESAYGFFDNNEENGINGWHKYGILWNENYISWQLDGKTFLKQRITDNNAYCFQKEQFFLFNLAIGGDGTGFTAHRTANAETFQTTTMYVDYLRVYELSNEDIASLEGGEATTPVVPTETVSPYPPVTEESAPNPETITYTTDEIVDAVAEKNTAFTTYQGTSWASGAAISSAQTSVEGAVINVSDAGNNLWGLQAHSEDLRVVAGNIYRLKTTLLSTIDKSVRVKVRGNDSDNYIFFDKTISLNANEPYSIDEDVIIPLNFNGTVDIDYGFGENNIVNETLDHAGFTLTISDTAFTTLEKVVHWEYAPTTEPESTSESQSITEQGLTTGEMVSSDNGTETVSSDGNVTNQKIAKVKIKSIAKKKSAKAVKIKLKKKLKSVTGYQVRFFKTKKNAKANKKALVKRTYKKNKKTFKVKSKKLKNRKKLFVRIRGYKLVGTKKYYGKWSVSKKVKMK